MRADSELSAHWTDHYSTIEVIDITWNVPAEVKCFKDITIRKYILIEYREQLYPMNCHVGRGSHVGHRDFLKLSAYLLIKYRLWSYEISK